MIRHRKMKKRRNPEKPDKCSLYSELVVQLLKDAASSCQLRPSIRADRDVVTVNTRASSEGIAFFTKALPSLGKCLDKALSSDEPVSFVGTSFVLSKKAPYFPKFMGAYWKLIFDDEGLVRDRFDCHYRHQVEAVRAIRQICFLLYKLEGCYSKEDEINIVERFIEVDKLLPGEDDEVSLSPEAELAIGNATLLLQFLFMGLNTHDIQPKHGPGAVATGEDPHEKMNFKRIYETVEEVYPFTDYYFYNYSHLCDNLENLEDMEIIPHGIAEIRLVPKDSRGPRIISMEPLEIQWIQQGLLNCIVPHLEQHSSPCSGRVNFTDQSINRDLALTNSFCGMFNTYDMKEASDRVSTWLVKKIFPPPLFRSLNACRSKETLLPSGDRHTLNKFAPMGSAVCFPIEALVFWAVAVGSIRHIRTRGDLVGLPDIYVYGDDIVAQPGHYDKFAPVFEELFLEFNEDKCCTGRFFKESCGMDAFKLQSVNPVRVRAPWSESPSPAATLSYVTYVNSLRERGYFSAASFLQKEVTRVSGLIPFTNKPDHSGLMLKCDWSTTDLREELLKRWKSRYNNGLQRTEIRIPVVVPVKFSHGDPDWDQLFRAESVRGVSNPSPFFPLEAAAPCSYTVPRRLTTRWKWVALSALLT